MSLVFNIFNTFLHILCYRK